MRCRFRRIRCRSGIGFRRKGAINVVDERIPESVRLVELKLDCKDGVVFVLTCCTWGIDHRLPPGRTRMDPVYPFSSRFSTIPFNPRESDYYAPYNKLINVLFPHMVRLLLDRQLQSSAIS